MTAVLVAVSPASNLTHQLSLYPIGAVSLVIMSMCSADAQFEAEHQVARSCEAQAFSTSLDLLVSSAGAIRVGATPVHTPVSMCFALWFDNLYLGC